MGEAAHLYLERFLDPITEILAEHDVTDLFINHPGEYCVERLGGETDFHSAPDLDDKSLHRLARQVAAQSRQGISAASPLLSTALPNGIRVQVILPPAAEGSPIFAFRKPNVAELGLDDFERGGTFASTAIGSETRSKDRELVRLSRARDFPELLRVAIRQRRNILVSGGTSSGKTTFLNGLLAEIPEEERLVTVEDTREVRLSHRNRVHLLVARNQMGQARVSSDDLLVASLRLRPDRIILGEIRGVEAFTFLRAINTGHPGSMTTIHADTPARAREQLALLVLSSGSTLSRADVIDYVSSVIDVYVQMEKRAGERLVTVLELAPHIRAGLEEKS